MSLPADATSPSERSSRLEVVPPLESPLPPVAESPLPPSALVRTRLPARAGEDVRAFARAAGLTATLADVLQRRGHGDARLVNDFLDANLSSLTDPTAMVDRDLAARRLADALRRGERVAVFGDYDCDGMTATAIVTEVVRELGGDAVPLLASRFDGGYGVSPAAVRRIVDSGARLLVTCDCGSSDHATLRDVTAAGIDVIVIDHHLVPDEPLPALAFLNPHRPECGFPYKGLASCGLALSLAAALRKELSRELDVRRWLDLVAIGTIADVAPLDGDNRALVRAGLARLRDAQRPGLRALGELGKLDATSPVTGEDVAFRLAPRLNAPGRLGPPDLALSLLLATSHEQARSIAAEIEALSTQRRALSQQMIADAQAEVEREGWQDGAAIVIGRQGWSHGIVGIVAGRLCERYARPVIVIGFEGEHGRGSVRGPKGSRLHDAVSAVAPCLTRFGGHQAAAGLELPFDRLAELRQRFEQSCAAGVAAPDPLDAQRDRATLCWLDPADELIAVVRDLERLEPCGENNPAPSLIVEASVVSAREVKGGHLKLELALPGRRRLSAFAFAEGARAATLSERTTLIGKLRRDSWRGGDAVELRVEEFVDATR